MAINSSFLTPRLADRRLFLAAAIGFPLIVFIGYFKSYYASAFFDSQPIANWLVHVHGIVMSVWVAYFTAQVVLIRTKNVKLHMTMGMVGVALAAVVVLTGLATAYDSNLVRQSAPPGVHPYAFFLLPLGDMVQFVIYFTAAVYYRKRPAEHKSLMLLTAINFVPAALFRLPVVAPEYTTLWAFGAADIVALACLAWHSWKHGKVNRVFAAGVLLMIVSVPLRLAIGETETWLAIAGWLAP